MASISALAISNSVILLILYNLASFPKYFISASNLVAFSAALIFLECVEELDSVEDFLPREPPECEETTDDFSSKAFLLIA